MTPVMGEIRVLVLATFLRVSIFNLLLLVNCVFDGIPDVNSAFLMFSFILLIPLPRLEPLLFILDEIYSKTSVYLRRAHTLFSWISSLVLSPARACLNPVFRWLIRRCSIFVFLLRGAIHLCVAVITWFVPTSIYNALLSVYQTVATGSFLWVRSIYWFVYGPLRWIHSVYRMIHTISTTDASENPFSLKRCFIHIVFTVVALIIALPSPVSVLNYIVTGYGYPGSTLRFHNCPAIRGTNLLSYLFLEISYSLWNIARTISFYFVSKYYLPGLWNIEIDIKSQIGPGYTTWLMGYSRMLCVGVVTPFVLPFQCFEQVINNVLCTLCHVAFLTVLNGHKCANFFMIYYGVCSILVHIGSTLVALTSTLHSLRLTVNNNVTTVICMMQLYLLLHVSWLTCKLIWRKIKKPSEDVLWKLE